MDAATWGFIGTLFGAVVGGGVSVLTTHITSSNARELQKDSDSLRRREAASEFQRNNLLKLQESLTEQMRLVGQAHVEDSAAFRKNPGGDGSTNYLSEPLNENLSTGARRAGVLAERIANDELREEVKILLGKMAGVLYASTELSSKKYFEDAMTACRDVMTNIGIELRSTYEQD